MDIELSQLHFIRPSWLLLLPIILGVWLLLRRSLARSNWEDYIPKPVVEALQIKLAQGSDKWLWCLLASYLTLAIAAAGPTWSKQAVPALQNHSAMVVALDLSPSMLAQDLVPDRLTLAKYKLIDILRKQSDTQVALVAYAGDAHTVSPLTDDPYTIEALLPALHPNIMPSRGSNVEAAMALATQLLQDAGASSGHIMLISDGIADDAIDALQDHWNKQYRLSILAVGGQQGAPIPEQGGGFMRNTQGEIVLASVDSRVLRSLAFSLGGRFANLSSDDTDLNKLLIDRFEPAESSSLLDIDERFDAWVDMGHFLILLALPLLLICFRKGLIYSLALIFILPIDSDVLAQSIAQTPATANVKTSDETRESNSDFWSSVWKTPDQQAAGLFKQDKFAEAAQKFNRPDWSAIANYRAGNYQQAASKLDKEDLTSLYNKANALAFSGELEAAIKTYDRVLEQDKDHLDAAHNKQVVEQLLQQQEKEDQQEPSDDQGDDQQQKQDPSEKSDSKEDSEPSDDESKNQQQGEEPQPNEEPQPGEEPQPNEEPQPGEEQGEQQEPDAASSQAAKERELNDQQQAEKMSAAEPEEQLKDTSEQWLRSIADDPSGLLRRKFEYQSQQRVRQRQPSNNNQERF
jgi:Ca-activated chloride channel family protein